MIMVHFIGGPEDGRVQLVEDRDFVWFAEQSEIPDDLTQPVECISHRYEILRYTTPNRWSSGLYYGFHESLRSQDSKIHALKIRALI